MNEIYFLNSLSNIDYSFKITTDTGFKIIETKYGNYAICPPFTQESLMDALVYLKSLQLESWRKEKI